MSDTETHKSESPGPAEYETPSDAVSPVDSEALSDAPESLDAALEAIARLDESTDQLLNESDDDAGDTGEDLDQLLAEVASLDEDPPDEFEPGSEVDSALTSTPVAEPESVSEPVLASEQESDLASEQETQFVSESAAVSEPEPVDESDLADMPVDESAVAPVEEPAADESDALFDSDFDPVEDVLNTVFETKAALVQRGESTTVTVREEMSPAAPEESPMVGNNDDEPFDSSDAVQDAGSLSTDDDPEPQADAIQSTDEQTGSAPELSAAVAEADETVEPAAVEAPADAVGEAIVADDADEVAAKEPGVDESDEPVAATAVVVHDDEPAAPVDDAEPVAAAHADANEPQQEQEPKFDYIAWLVAKLNALFGGLLPGVKNALVLSNKPMRYVPTSLRPLVDYLALTLVMWVPIVWVIVWLVQR